MTVSSIFINIIISIVIVLLLHFSWNYVVEKYGNHHTKNLLEFQTKKYLTIIDELANKQKMTDSLTMDSLTIIPLDNNPLDIQQNLEKFVTELSK